jgi:hypothetical protein
MAKQQKSEERKATTTTSIPLPAKEPLNKASGISNEDIARRAYEIYQARGGEDGRDADDWYQAERELKLGKQ